MHSEYGTGSYYGGGLSTGQHSPAQTTTAPVADGPSVAVSKLPKVFIDDEVYQKIMYWVNKSSDEVSGLGRIKRVGDDVHVISVMLLPQKNTGASTDIEPEDVAKAMYETREQEGDLQFWWHSHVNMNVFWSGTDTDTIKKISEGGWFVSTVFNKRRELRTAVSMNTPFGIVMIDKVETSINRSLDGNLVKAWDAEYTEKVTKHIPKQQPWSGNNYRNWNSQATASRNNLPSISREQRAVARIVDKVFPPSAGEASTHPYSHLLHGEEPLPDGSGKKRGLLSDGGYQTPQQVLARRNMLERKIAAISMQERNLRAKGKGPTGGMVAAKAKHQAELDEINDDIKLLAHYGMIDEREVDSPGQETVPEETTTSTNSDTPPELPNSQHVEYNGVE